MPDDVIAAIHRLAMEEPGLSPERIMGRLEVDARYTGRVPRSVVTVRKYVSEVRLDNVSANEGLPWAIDEDLTGQPRLVLKAIRAITQQSETARILSRAEAELVARIGEAVPSLGPVGWWRLARIILGRRARGAPIDDLTLLMALEPWRDEVNGWNRYFHLALQSRLDPPHFLMSLLRDRNTDPLAWDYEALDRSSPFIYDHMRRDVEAQRDPPDDATGPAVSVTVIDPSGEKQVSSDVSDADSSPTVRGRSPRRKSGAAQDAANGGE